MKLYIDGEWNSYKGELISMALVSPEGHRWYEVIEGAFNIDPWVAENVMPKLGKEAIPYRKFQESLGAFLNQFDTVHVIADWPEDLARFCDALITGPGERIDTPNITLEIIRVDSVSNNPHNALSDAICFMNQVESSDG